jgi:hypothetical protein
MTRTRLIDFEWNMLRDKYGEEKAANMVNAEINLTFDWVQSSFKGYSPLCIKQSDEYDPRIFSGSKRRLITLRKIVEEFKDTWFGKVGLGKVLLGFGGCDWYPGCGWHGGVERIFFPIAAKRNEGGGHLFYSAMPFETNALSSGEKTYFAEFEKRITDYKTQADFVAQDEWANNLIYGMIDMGHGINKGSVGPEFTRALVYVPYIHGGSYAIKNVFVDGILEVARKMVKK